MLQQLFQISFPLWFSLQVAAAPPQSPASPLLARAGIVPADNTDDALKPYWTVHDGSRSKGGCKGDLNNLKISWNEACKAARQANDDVRFIQLPNIKNGGRGPDEKTHPEDRKRWNRVFNTYLTLFGNPFDNSGKAKPNGIEYVYGFFGELVTTCSSRQDKLAEDKYADLFCDDKYWKFIKKGTVDPGDEKKRNIEVTQPESKTFGGMWYSDQLRAQDPKKPYIPSRYVTGPVPDEKKFTLPFKTRRRFTCELAGGDTLAWADSELHVVTWCPNGLDGSIVSIADIKKDIKAPKAQNAQDAGKLIKDKKLTYMDALDMKKPAMTTTWIHEMGHFIGAKFADEDAYDDNGQKIMTQGWTLNNDGTAYIKKEVPVGTYGWRQCANLARYHQESAARSPENLAHFAVAMYLEEWDWRNGYAQKPEDINN